MAKSTMSTEDRARLSAALDDMQDGVRAAQLVMEDAALAREVLRLAEEAS